MSIFAKSITIMVLIIIQYLKKKKFDNLKLWANDIRVIKSQRKLDPYLYGTLGQWDILLLNLTSIGFTNFLDVSSLTFPFLQMLML